MGQFWPGSIAFITVTVQAYNASNVAITDSSVDGTTVSGKSYEQVVKMIRGEAGTVVKVGVKDEKGLHELSVERVASDKLPRGPAESHGTPAP
mgnify:CR=1 FL=1